MTDAKVIMHKIGADALLEGNDWSAAMFGALQPTVTDIQYVSDGDYIDLNGTRLLVLHTPGHSPGSMCLYDASSQTLFSGDTIFADGGVGRTDFQGGDIVALHRSIERLTKLGVTSFIPDMVRI